MKELEAKALASDPDAALRLRAELAEAKTQAKEKKASLVASLQADNASLKEEVARLQGFQEENASLRSAPAPRKESHALIVVSSWPVAKEPWMMTDGQVAHGQWPEGRIMQVQPAPYMH